MNEVDQSVMAIVFYIAFSACFSFVYSIFCGAQEGRSDFDVVDRSENEELEFGGFRKRGRRGEGVTGRREKRSSGK